MLFISCSTEDLACLKLGSFCAPFPTIDLPVSATLSAPDLNLLVTQLSAACPKAPPAFQPKAPPPAAPAMPPNFFPA